MNCIIIWILLSFLCMPTQGYVSTFLYPVKILPFILCTTRNSPWPCLRFTVFIKQHLINKLLSLLSIRKVSLYTWLHTTINIIFIITTDIYWLWHSLHEGTYVYLFESTAPVQLSFILQARVSYFNNGGISLIFRLHKSFAFHINCHTCAANTQEVQACLEYELL